MSQLQALDVSRNPHGRLCLRTADGQWHEGITPVRAFPIAAPLEGISLVGADGKEVHWIAHLEQVPAAARELIEEDLAVREFVPLVQRIVSVDSISVPSTWRLETDRGPATLVLKAEEDIRKLEGRRHLLILGRDGVQYRIADTQALDRASQKLLERFL